MSDGTLTVAVGASRSGKTAWVKQRLSAYPVRLVWDVEGQYRQGNHVATSKRELIALAKHAAAKPCGIAYVAPSLDDFGYWADVAFWLVRAVSGKHQCAIVAEELADVTTPGKAPDQWGILIRRGLKYGADLYAITQRPSESDKTIMGNASVIHCCGLQRANDRKYMAAEMDVPAETIAGLNRGQLEYLHKDMRTLETSRGKLTF